MHIQQRVQTQADCMLQNPMYIGRVGRSSKTILAHELEMTRRMVQAYRKCNCRLFHSPSLSYGFHIRFCNTKYKTSNLWTVDELQQPLILTTLDWLEQCQEWIEHDTPASLQVYIGLSTDIT